MSRPEVTIYPFWRSHKRHPKGHGDWHFRRSRSRDARGDELFGETQAFSGTYTEARAQARRAMSDADFIAVLPQPPLERSPA